MKLSKYFLVFVRQTLHFNAGGEIHATCRLLSVNSHLFRSRCLLKKKERKEKKERKKKEKRKLRLQDMT